MTRDQLRRRKFVELFGGVTLAATLAGCSSDEAGEDETETTDDSGNDDTGGGDGSDDDTEDASDDSSDDGDGTEDETEDESEETNEDDDDDDDDTDESSSEPEEMTFSGSGAEVHDDLEIEGGLTVVEATHTGGSSNFQVHLVPSEGDFDEMFVNEIGEYEGATAALIDSDTYQLDVEADGDWEITIRQPRATSGDSLPQSIDGTVNEVFGPFEFGGSHTAVGEHRGDGNFIVQVYPPEGDWGELVFNEIDEYEGETTFRHDGVGYVAVEAGGDWSLSLE
ncbi:hypothetical protein [Natronosalvus halobius]|uniref:hypothetical protein n=1 Tax=Natronosalvus halobius TaxID=2953746 RepID=UPI00209FBD4C|nr:hypothetical protein [Natronosalvus halobius]USZ72033.1 hypothetical protein NGM15_01615 [Natronosalvus halobius]